MDIVELSSYLLIEATCVGLAVFIYFAANRDIARDYEIASFRRIIMVYFAWIAIDTVWCLWRVGPLELDIATSGLLSAVDGCVSLVVLAAWFMFAETMLGSSFVRNRTLRFAAMTPVFVALIVCIIATFMGEPVAYLNIKSQFVFGASMWIIPAVALVYLGVGAVHVLASAAKATTATQRNECIDLVLFAGVALVGYVLQFVMPQPPVLSIALLLAIFVVFVTLQGRRVFVDELTGLNNRRRFDNYLLQRIAQIPEKGAFCLVVLDVDQFKKINNRHGRAAGDSILQTVASALRLATNTHHGFIGRWGGDEFVYLVNSTDYTSFEQIKKTLDDALAEVVAREGVDYELTLSAGFADCAYENETPLALVHAANKDFHTRKHAAAEHRGGDAK